MKKIIQKMKEEDAFTLIEMALVILIIAALLLIIISNIGGVTETANDTTNDAIVQTVETQRIIYELEENVENASAEELEAAGYITSEQLSAYNAAR
jgi:competence protein ComGC